MSFCLLCLCSFQCKADQLNGNISTGYEQVSSPLVRIDVDSPLMLVEGRTKLAGRYYQFSLSGVKDWDIENASSLSLSASSSIKISPSAKDLNYGLVSIDGAWRKQLGSVSIGIGPSVQRVWIVNERFRDSVTMQTDITYVQPNGSFTDIYMDVSKSFFVEDYDFSNSKSTTLSFTHHINALGLGFSALDLQLSATREKNTQDFEDLSSRSFYARASIDRNMLGLTWSMGASLTKSNFDAPFFEGFPKRNDLYVSYEFGLEREFSDKMHMSLDFTKAQNRSNLVLYESDYRLLSLSLNYVY